MTDPNLIRTFHGIYMDPFSPGQSQIDIRDIAHALSLMCRANGHISRFYSVAQHCLNCEREAAARGYGARVRLLCLLHDAAECYISDLTRPVKRRLPDYYSAEERLAETIYSRLAGGPPDEAEAKAVGEIDDSLLYHEFLALCGVRLFDFEPRLYGELSFEAERFGDVRLRYIQRYNELLAGSGGESDGGCRL